MRALAALGRTNDVRTLVESSVGRVSSTAFEAVVDELRAHDREAEARSLGSRLVESARARLIDGSGSSLSARGAMVRAYLAAERWSEARRLADSLVQAHPASPSLLALKGRVAARQGDRRAAAMVLAALEQLGDPAVAAPNALSRARITALLGQRDEALALLHTALAEGEATLLRAREDPDFASLRSYGPFRVSSAAEEISTPTLSPVTVQQTRA